MFYGYEHENGRGKIVPIDASSGKSGRMNQKEKNQRTLLMASIDYHGCRYSGSRDGLRRRHQRRRAAEGGAGNEKSAEKNAEESSGKPRQERPEKAESNKKKTGRQKAG